MQNGAWVEIIIFKPEISVLYPYSFSNNSNIYVGTLASTY